MKSVRFVLEAALGLKSEGDKREHFFCSTLVETVFYGLFSAWALWFKKQAHTWSEHFDWRTAINVCQAKPMEDLGLANVNPLKGNS